MSLEQITVTVDGEVARAYCCASAAERRKLDLLVSLRLREATRSATSLRQVADELSQTARQRGLNPEILRDILEG